MLYTVNNPHRHHTQSAACGVVAVHKLPLFTPCSTRGAMSAGDADEVVRWDFCRLNFFAAFLVKQKSTEKIINMNGRLYDPVIARFFSPDNFVQIPEFTQSFNRYSYCLNNPLKYVDPSGMLWGEYRDWHGNYLGWDGKNDDNVFIVDDRKSIKTITQNDKAGLTTLANKVKIALTTTLTELRESVNVLNRTIDNGGFREEVSVVTPGGQIHRGKPGQVTTSGTATVTTPVVPGNDNTSIHSHLTGETADGRIWVPNHLGPLDKGVFSNYQRNIVVGKFNVEPDAIGGYRESGAVFYDRNAFEIGTLYLDPIYKILGGRK